MPYKGTLKMLATNLGLNKTSPMPPTLMGHKL